MDAELKSKWVKALRSGEYRQGRDALRKGDTYCCLGVLYCAPLGRELHPDSYRVHCRSAYDEIDALIGKSAASKLISMNDHGKPFSEIADFIEANL